MLLQSSYSNTLLHIYFKDLCKEIIEKHLFFAIPEDVLGLDVVIKPKATFTFRDDILKNVDTLVAINVPLKGNYPISM